MTKTASSPPRARDALVSDPQGDPPPHAHSAFRKVPRTGVIYVMGEAGKLGYTYKAEPGEDDWCNLGQGMPETGPLPGAPPRCESVQIQLGDQEYAPVAGLWELREAIASLYNQAYRRGMPSQYSAENVAAPTAASIHTPAADGDTGMNARNRSLSSPTVLGTTRSTNRRHASPAPRPSAVIAPSSSGL